MKQQELKLWVGEDRMLYHNAIHKIANSGWLKFELPIYPEAHADATMFTRTGHAYTPTPTKRYKKRCADALRQIKETRHKDVTFPLEGPCCVVWFFITQRPRSKLKKNNANIIIPEIGKCDTDGYVKPVKDCLQVPMYNKAGVLKRPGAGIITNDNQIFSEMAVKLHRKETDKEFVILWIKQYKLDYYTPFIELFI